MCVFVRRKNKPQTQTPQARIVYSLGNLSFPCAWALVVPWSCCCVTLRPALCTYGSGPQHHPSHCREVVSWLLWQHREVKSLKPAQARRRLLRAVFTHWEREGQMDFEGTRLRFQVLIVGVEEAMLRYFSVITVLILLLECLLPSPDRRAFHCQLTINRFTGVVKVT